MPCACQGSSADVWTNADQEGAAAAGRLQASNERACTSRQSRAGSCHLELERFEGLQLPASVSGTLLGLCMCMCSMRLFVRITLRWVVAICLEEGDG